jgi:hypothetical protein
MLRIKEMYWRPTQRQMEFLYLLKKPDVRRDINNMIAERARKYVPYNPDKEDSESQEHLRDTMHATPGGVSYDTPYARYQYVGEIYCPNFLIKKGPNAGKWRSPVGELKHPTGRRIRNYTTPGTRHHWIALMWDMERRAMQNQITAYLKKRANV